MGFGISINQTDLKNHGAILDSGQVLTVPPKISNFGAEATEIAIWL
jgi:hypothetical protein